SRHIIAISPDGSSIVYSANNQLYLRKMTDLQARPLPGTGITGQNITEPFFSPDGRWVGFYSGGESKLKKVAVAGGAALPVYDTRGIFGAAWGADDQIIIADGPNGILRIPAGGGKPETLTTLQSDEFAHSPQILPGGDSVLFTVAAGNSID